MIKKINSVLNLSILALVALDKNSVWFRKKIIDLNLVTQRINFQRKEQVFISVRPSSALKMWVKILFQPDITHEARFLSTFYSTLKAIGYWWSEL